MSLLRALEAARKAAHADPKGSAAKRLGLAHYHLLRPGTRVSVDLVTGGFLVGEVVDVARYSILVKTNEGKGLILSKSAIVLVKVIEEKPPYGPGEGSEGDGSKKRAEEENKN